MAIKDTYLARLNRQSIKPVTKQNYKFNEYSVLEANNKLEGSLIKAGAGSAWKKKTNPPNTITDIAGISKKTPNGFGVISQNNRDLYQDDNYSLIWTPSLVLPSAKDLNKRLYTQPGKPDEYNTCIAFANYDLHLNESANGIKNWPLPRNNASKYAADYVEKCFRRRDYLDFFSDSNSNDAIRQFIILTALLHKDNSIGSNTSNNGNYRLVKLSSDAVGADGKVRLSEGDEGYLNEAISTFAQMARCFIQSDFDAVGELFNYLGINTDSSAISLVANTVIPYFSEVSAGKVSSFPIVIDKQFGDYSSDEDVASLAYSVIAGITIVKNEDSIRNSGNRAFANINCDRSNRATPNNRTILFLSNNELERQKNLYYLNYTGFSRLFVDAICKFLSFDIWDNYNKNVLVNFVIDNWWTSPGLNDRVAFDNTLQGATGSAVVSYSYDRLAQGADLSVNDIRSSIRSSRKNSIFTLSDYNWSMSSNPMVNINEESFQTLDVFEFQPDRQLSYQNLAKNILSAIGDMNLDSRAAGAIGGGIENITGGVANKLSGGLTHNPASGLGEFAAGSTVAKNVVTLGAQAVINANDNTEAAIQNAKEYATSVDWIDQQLSGYWVGNYTLPYFGEEFISASAGRSDGWSMGNLAGDDKHGESFIKDGLSANVQDIPTWSYDPDIKGEISTTLYLLNDTFKNTIKNLQFLFAISAGAFWVQHHQYRFRSPNLYRVFCPGRFVMLYASIGIQAKFFGKVRKFTESDGKTAGKIIFGESQPEFTRFGLSQHDCNIPEAYEVNISFRDLTPNAFNVFASYQLGKESNIYPSITTQRIESHSVGSSYWIENTYNDTSSSIVNSIR